MAANEVRNKLRYGVFVPVFRRDGKANFSADRVSEMKNV
jgi:hypothetical protein